MKLDDLQSAVQPLVTETLKQVLPILRDELKAPSLSPADVEQIAREVFGKLSDKTPYAPENHRHPLSDIDGAAELTQGLAKDRHRHGFEDIDGLPDQLQAHADNLRSAIPTDTAPKVHRHPFDDIDGQVPTHRLADGARLLLALQKIDDMKSHRHPDLEQAVAAVAQRIDALPKPREYDDEPLREDLRKLVSRVEQLAQVKPVVEVSVGPIPVPSVTCRCAYLIVDGDPGTVSVKDAKGLAGSVKVTSDGGRSVIRPVFDTDFVQPLSFTFPSTPTLCAIGSSPAPSES